jgi:hypothetical protein
MVQYVGSLFLVLTPLKATVFLHELTIESLLFGDDTLTELQNLQIFKSVQLYRHHVGVLFTFQK